MWILSYWLVGHQILITHYAAHILQLRGQQLATNNSLCYSYTTTKRSATTHYATHILQLRGQQLATITQCCSYTTTKRSATSY